MTISSQLNCCIFKRLSVASIDQSYLSTGHNSYVHITGPLFNLKNEKKIIMEVGNFKLFLSTGKFKALFDEKRVHLLFRVGI